MTQQDKKTAEQILAPLIEVGGLRVLHQDSDYIRFKTKFDNPITLENIPYTKDELKANLLHNPFFRKLLRRDPGFYSIIQQIWGSEPEESPKGEFKKVKEGEKVRFDDSESVTIDNKLSEHRWQLSKDYVFALLTALGLVTAYFGLVVSVIVAFLIWGLGGYLGWMEEKLSKSLDNINAGKLHQLQQVNRQQAQEINSLTSRLTIIELKEDNQRLKEQAQKHP